jgi:hypothetical protein
MGVFKNLHDDNVGRYFSLAQIILLQEADQKKTVLPGV